MRIKALLVVIATLSTLFSASCSNEGTEVTGRIYSYEHLGFKCWYLRDENTGFQYELISNDQFLLQEKTRIKAKLKPTNRETICKVGDRMEIASYKIMSFR
jgi:hypothetical protein